MVYCRNLLDKLGLDEDEIINMKMTMNEAKYPVEKEKGSNKKYTELWYNKIIGAVAHLARALQFVDG